MGDEVSGVFMSHGENQRKYHLARDCKVVQEVFPWYNWTLRDKRRTISVISCRLEEAMPMLQTKRIDILDHIERKRFLTIDVTRSRDLSVSLSMTSSWKLSPCGLWRSEGR